MVWKIAVRKFSIYLFAYLIIIIIFSPGCQRDGREMTRTRLNPVNVEEITIARIHQLYQEGDLTCRQLVEIYINRIETYDQSKKLNSIVLINPRAIKDAQALDDEFKRTGRLKPLHGIPVIVKDNYNTKDLQTTGGSAALRGSRPSSDAFQVEKIRAAGAVILAKSNMAEWAFSPMVTISSIAGETRNPYDLERVPAGSSGGTAAAVAANFAVVGLGTDTGNSIRGPSAHTALVGIRSTMGLTSRSGIIPLYLRNDIGGPMARTVEDAARILEVIAGYDPADPITARSKNRIPVDYRQFLDKSGLKGVKIGVFRPYLAEKRTDPEVLALVEAALQDLRDGGAEIIDPFQIAGLDQLGKNLWCDTFRADVNRYLQSLGEGAPYQNLEEIVASGLFSEYIEGRLKRALRSAEDSGPACKDLFQEVRNIRFREAVLQAMEEYGVDLFVYPTWGFPPRKIGDFKSPAADNSQLIPPHTGLPAITVPMGYSRGSLPAGLQMVGPLYGEPLLLKVAYAYEQATRHRKAPVRFPRIKSN